MELVGPVGREGQTNEPPGMCGHEIDGFRGHGFGSDDQVALVFPVFIVYQDHEFPGTNVFKGFVDGIEVGRHGYNPSLPHLASPYKGEGKTCTPS